MRSLFRWLLRVGTLLNFADALIGFSALKVVKEHTQMAVNSTRSCKPALMVRVSQKFVRLFVCCVYSYPTNRFLHAGAFFLIPYMVVLKRQSLEHCGLAVKCATPGAQKRRGYYADCACLQ